MSQYIGDREIARRLYELAEVLGEAERVAHNPESVTYFRNARLGKLTEIFGLLGKI